jgi:simple sugar transport system permease protein
VSGGEELPLSRGLGQVVNKRTEGNWATALYTVASSLVAVLIALGIAAALLAATGINPGTAYSKMFELATKTNTIYDALQRSTPLMISAVAVAIGFKMNLFNIGVEGQYKVGAFFGAIVGANISLPAPLHVLVILVVAAVAGGAWAGIAAVLKVKRGVNEVISTIMLNYIALSLLQFLFDNYFRDDSQSGLNVKTKLIPPSGWMPDIVKGRLSWYFVIGIVIVVFYWLLVFKSRFGFRLRASGMNATAARTSGISSGRMIIVAMVISGCVAGLIAMGSVLGDLHAYGQDLPKGWGFAGIAVALLGRNHPAGIVSAALLFGMLNATSGGLQLAGVPNSIVDIIQAIIVLTVVIVNEAVTRRLSLRTTQRTAAALELQAVPA